MNIKYVLIQCYISLFYYLNDVEGRRLRREIKHEWESVENEPPELDEIDRLTINQTGCKYVGLVNRNIVTYSLNSTRLSHTNMSYLGSDVTPATKFEMHFAIRADGGVRVLLFSRNQYMNKSRWDPDFEFELGIGDDNDFLDAALLKANENEKVSIRRSTPSIMSAIKYVKLYIRLDEDYLKFGKECDARPIYDGENHGMYSTDIVLVGFASKSGKKRILYDCPSNFGDCE